MKSVVLFGAGASFGAGGIFPTAPPLGSSLFSELARRFPSTWGSIPNDLTAEFVADFERGMAKLWHSGSHVVSRLMQEMAIYFASFRLSTAREDAYSRLIAALADRGRLDDVRFSTLNYECVLEIALAQAGRTIDYFGTDPASYASVVWKIHGSCNFLPHGGVEATRAVSYSSGVTFGTGIKACEPAQVAQYCDGDTALYPVMAIYMAGKPVQIAPGSLSELQKRWATAVRSADRIAIIGVRPRPDDWHVWSLLAEAEGELGFIGDLSEAQSWAHSHRRGKPVNMLAKRFDEGWKALAEWI